MTLSPPDPDHVFGPPADGEPALWAELAAVALEVATEAGRQAGKAFGQVRARVDTKSSPTDMVSEVDRAVESTVARILADRRPEDGLLGEEGADRAGTSGVRWIVDPLDGTTNYLFGIPSWSVSVAAEVDGRTVVGVVVDPSQHETWAAVAGRGARLDGQPVAVAEGRSQLATALVATGFSYRAEHRRWQGAVAATLLPEVRDLRRIGSAALDLCWVAGGRLDAFYEWGLRPWDRAAGILICSEAGGRAATEPDGLVVASTAALWDPLVDLLHRAGAGAPPA